jgi:hypothetical protein
MELLKNKEYLILKEKLEQGEMLNEDSTNEFP